MILLATLHCALALSLAAPPPGAPMTKREARKLFQLPRGSVSLGMTNGGMLVAGVAMPLTGKGFKVFPGFVKRETHWGTQEMVTLLKRAGAQVRKEFRGSVLGIGNISKKEGGQTGFSVSHKSGRDADIAMFAFDRRGKRINLMNFVKFQEDGWDSKRHYRFDAQRNLALVTALLGQPDIPVQYIFVARWLKKQLLAEADKKGVDPEMRRRLDEVLWMPSDSNPHQDHFHVRIYCSVQDRLHGCLERGPVRDWVDLGDDALAAHAAKLEQVAAMKDLGLRRRALEQLGKIRATSAMGTLMAALNDPDAKTRETALEALERMGSPYTLPGLVHALTHTDDGQWAAELLRSMARIGGRTIADVAVVVLERPGELLSEPLARSLPAPLRERAVRILSRFGRKSAVPPLLAALQSGSRALQKLAHEALRRVTNQPIGSKARSSKQLEEATQAWRAFYAKHGKASWIEWQRLGFVARGVRLPQRLTKTNVPRIIEVITSKDAVASDNAIWLLGALTGHEQDPAWRSKRNNQRHWRSWWRDNGATLPEELPPPAPTAAGSEAPPAK